MVDLEIIIEEQLVDVAVEWTSFLEVLVVNVSAVGWVHSYKVTSAVVLRHGLPEQLLILGPRHLLEELLVLQELGLLFNEDVDLFNEFLVRWLTEVVCLYVGNCLASLALNLVESYDAV